MLRDILINSLVFLTWIIIKGKNAGFEAVWVWLVLFCPLDVAKPPAAVLIYLELRFFSTNPKSSKLF